MGLIEAARFCERGESINLDSHAQAPCKRLPLAPYFPSMSLKNAACLALTGASFLTFVLLVHLVMDSWGVFYGGVPAIHLGASLIRAFAGLSMAVFLYTFYRKQA
jgi:hypothetical protein